MRDLITWLMEHGVRVLRQHTVGDGIYLIVMRLPDRSIQELLVRGDDPGAIEILRAELERTLEGSRNEHAIGE